MSLMKNDSMDSKDASSESEGEYHDKHFADLIAFEADKDRIVEHSPRGRFIRFNEELGSGAYKTVYKAYDNETGHEVAWNVIRLPNLHAKDRKRISDEISLLKKLKHSNIILFISAWLNKQKEEIVFITEVVTGGSLKKYLNKIKTPRLKVIKSWCKEILQGIEYLHTLKPHPIIHRDIKCDNIFINSNKGEIRIGDLGLATFMSNAYAASVLGTPEFMAPEMYEEVYGPSVDIYSFGMCVLEMVTNQTPYRECMNPAQIYKKVINGIKPAALDLILNEEVKRFISECLKPRDERPSVTDLLNHPFVQIIDQEADNQPVSLLGSPEKGSNEEEKINLNIVNPQQLPTQPKEKAPRLEYEETVDKSINKTFGKDVSGHHEPFNQEKVRICKQEEHGKSLVNRSRKSSGCFQQDDRCKELPCFKELQLGKFKSQQNPTGNVNNLTLEKRVTDETKPDTLCDKSESTQDPQHTPVNINLNLSEKKDPMRYSFHSKGIINGNLILQLKIETQGNLFEQTLGIRRDKISQEKITQKLLKRLNFPNTYNDPYFFSQIKALFESLDYLNMSTSIQSVYPPITSATSINAKSPSQANFESHSHQEKTNIVYSQLFASAYQHYLTQIPREHLLNETEEGMSFRQQGEMLELQNRHLMQRRNLWDRKHNILSSSTLALGQKSQSVETEDIQNRLHQISENTFKNHHKIRGHDRFLFSPLSSGPLSPMMSNGNVSSTNNSVEIMASLLKKLGNLGDDVNRSISHHLDTLSENDKIFRSNLVSPNNQELVTRAVSDKTGDVFKFPQVLQRNPSFTSQISSNQLTPNEIITPNTLVSPRHFNLTSPKDITSAVLSPKGFRAYVTSPQNKVSPTRITSDKSEKELPEKKSEKCEPTSLSTISEKNEEKLLQSQILSEQKTRNHLIELPKTPSFQEKDQDSVSSEKEIRNPDSKKGSKYGSLTINTEMVNQGDKKGGISRKNTFPGLPLSESREQTPKEGQVQTQTPKETHSLNDLNGRVNGNNGNNGNNVNSEANPFVRSTFAEPAKKKSPGNEGLRQNSAKNGTLIKIIEAPVNSNNDKKSSRDITPKNTAPPQVFQFGFLKNNNNNSTPHNMAGTANTSQHSSSNLNQTQSQTGSKNTIESIATIKSPKAEDKQIGFPAKLSSPKIVGDKEGTTAFQKVMTGMSSPHNAMMFTFGPPHQEQAPQKENRPEEFKANSSLKPKSTIEIIRYVKCYKFKGAFGKNMNEVDMEEVKVLQWSLELLAGQEISSHSQMKYYTENLLKNYQEKNSFSPDGILTVSVWEKMLAGTEKLEKAWMIKESSKQKLINDLTVEREEIKKKIKDKQNKEASESLNKIENKLLDLSRLMD